MMTLHTMNANERLSVDSSCRCLFMVLSGAPLHRYSHQRYRPRATPRGRKSLARPLPCVGTTPIVAHVRFVLVYPPPPHLLCPGSVRVVRLFVPGRKAAGSSSPRKTDGAKDTKEREEAVSRYKARSMFPFPSTFGAASLLRLAFHASTAPRKPPYKPATMHRKEGINRNTNPHSFAGALLGD